jgi:hypothetical protein
MHIFKQEPDFIGTRRWRPFNSRRFYVRNDEKLFRFIEIGSPEIIWKNTPSDKSLVGYFWSDFRIYKMQNCFGVRLSVLGFYLHFHSYKLIPLTEK